MMTNDRTARMFGDPPYRADAYADVTKRMERELREQQERVAADQNWRSEYKGRIQRELVTGHVALPPIEQQAIGLWEAQTPIGDIAARLSLTLGQVYQIVSAA